MTSGLCCELGRQSVGTGRQADGLARERGCPGGLGRMAAETKPSPRHLLQ